MKEKDWHDIEKTPPPNGSDILVAWAEVEEDDRIHVERAEVTNNKIIMYGDNVSSRDISQWAVLVLPARKEVEYAD